MCRGDFRWVVVEPETSATGAFAVVDAYASPIGDAGHRRGAAATRQLRQIAEEQKRNWLSSESSLREMDEESLRQMYGHRRAALVDGDEPALAPGKLPESLQAMLSTPQQWADV